MAIQKEDDFVYVRISYRGFIPELNRNGPIKASFISKEQFRLLVTNEYDVMLLNPGACPAFAKQMGEYRTAIANKEYAAANKIVNTTIDERPNSVLKTALEAANAAPSAAAVVPTGNTVIQAALEAQNAGAPGDPDATVLGNAYASQLGIIENSEQTIGAQVSSDSIIQNVADANAEAAASSAEVNLSQNVFDPDAPAGDEILDDLGNNGSKTDDIIPGNTAAVVVQKHNGKKNR